MKRTAVAVFVGFVAAAAVFALLGRASVVGRPTVATPAPISVEIVPRTSDSEDRAPVTPSREDFSSATPLRSVALRPTATAFAASVIASVPERTAAAAQVSLTAIPSEIPDVVPAAVGDVTAAVGVSEAPKGVTSSAGPDAPPSEAGARPSDAPPSTRPDSARPSARPAVPPPVAGPTRAALPRLAPEPRYPAQVRARDGEGAVTVRFVVAADGRVTEVSVVGASGDPALRSAVVETVRLWTFEPALDAGRPVPSTVIRRFVFRLDDAP